MPRGHKKVRLALILLAAGISLAAVLGGAKGALNGNDAEPEGLTYAIDVRGGYAYVGAGRRFVVVDVSHPSKPMVAGEVQFPSGILDIFVAGALAYVADGDSGLRIVDVRNSAAPVEIGAARTAGEANGVYVARNYAYVADGEAGMRIIDVSDPMRPRTVGVSPTSGWDHDLDVSDARAYVGAGEAGLRIVDVANPAAPAEIGSYRTANDVTGVAVAGNRVYVAAGGSGLRVIDVTDPANPIETGHDDHKYAGRIVLRGRHAFIAGQHAGIWVADISRTGQVRVIAESSVAGSANGIAAADDYSYIADGTGGLLVVQHAPDSLQELRRWFLSLAQSQPANWPH